MLNYLYYKLYKAAGRTSYWIIASFSASLFFCLLISVNLVTVSLFLAGTYHVPLLASRNYLIALVAIASILILVFYYNKKRQTAILNRYSEESINQRILGNIALACYVILSYLLLIAAAVFLSKVNQSYR